MIVYQITIKIIGQDDFPVLFDKKQTAENFVTALMESRTEKGKSLLSYEATEVNVYTADDLLHIVRSM